MQKNIFAVKFLFNFVLDLFMCDESKHSRYLAVVTTNQAVSIQIKKNTNSKYAKDKDNSAEKFSRKAFYSNASRIFKESLKNFDQPQTDILIVKYGLRDKFTKKLPYDYLNEAENNFVYFDGKKIVQSSENFIY